jgi:hypothetical protein
VTTSVTKCSRSCAAPKSARTGPGLAKDLAKQGQPVAFHRGEGTEALHPRLAALLGELRVGQTSALAMVEGRPYLMRILAETAHPPKPYDEVVAEVHKALLARRTSDAIGKVSAELLRGARVEYLDRGQGQK